MNNIFDNMEELEKMIANLSDEELQDLLAQVDAKLEALQSAEAENDEEAYEDGEIDNIIVLNDEEGNEAEFEFIDYIEYEGEEYVVLLPCDDDDRMVVILRVEATDGEGEAYVSVDDDETLQAVFEIFKERAKDLFNFED